jgi:hypothetical protein
MTDLRRRVKASRAAGFNAVTVDADVLDALLDVVDAARADVKALGTDTRIDCECSHCATATAIDRLDALTAEGQTDE